MISYFDPYQYSLPIIYTEL